MLDPESRANEGLDDGATEDVDLISQLSDMKIGGGDKEDKVCTRLPTYRFSITVTQYRAVWLQ